MRPAARTERAIIRATAVIEAIWERPPESRMMAVLGGLESTANEPISPARTQPAPVASTFPSEQDEPDNVSRDFAGVAKAKQLNLNVGAPTR
jgi:hypothetical protein